VLEAARRLAALEQVQTPGMDGDPVLLAGDPFQSMSL
jgi:hypothetical protein